MTKIAAIIYACLAAFVIIFQIALTFGAPWGEYAMGGFHHGTYDVKLKFVALFQIFIIAVMAVIVLLRAEILKGAPIEAAKRGMWLVLFLSFLSMVMNLITPSKKERMLWAPVAIVMFLCAATVARGEDERA